MRLTASEAARAAAYNAANAHSVGWMSRYAQILVILGFDRVCPSGEAFAQAVADWQAGKPGLTVDGKIGSNTWGRMEPETRFSTPGGVPPSWLTPAPSGGGGSSTPPPRRGIGPDWLQVAQGQKARWEAETAGWSNTKLNDAEKYLDWDEAYFAASPMWGNKVHAPGETVKAGRNLDWCAAFVNFCLHSAGFSHTGSAGAGSFIQSNSWKFNALKSPRQGCVIVVGNAGAAHVAFLWDYSGLPEDPGGHVVTSGMTVRLLGGNQSDRITISRDRRRLLAATGMNGVKSPYLWPEVGPARCNIPLATAQEHYCRYTV